MCNSSYTQKWVRASTQYPVYGIQSFFGPFLRRKVETGGTKRHWGETGKKGGTDTFTHTQFLTKTQLSSFFFLFLLFIQNFLSFSIFIYRYIDISQPSSPFCLSPFLMLFSSQAESLSTTGFRQFSTWAVNSWHQSQPQIRPPVARHHYHVPMSVLHFLHYQCQGNKCLIVLRS